MPVPDELMQRLLAQAARFVASGAAPARPRLAATVLLLRPAAPVIEVYLLRRAARMAFAAGMYAFPGGTVDPVDHSGSDPGPHWPARLGHPESDAHAVVRAAIRELVEETGVRVAPGDLVPWTRWVTPEFEPRRYDTSFFVAALPPGQQPADLSGEADHTEWLPPAEAVARWRAGTIAMLPPTVVTLTELAGHDTVAGVLAAAAGRDAATPILPRVAPGPDGAPVLVY